VCIFYPSPSLLGMSVMSAAEMVERELVELGAVETVEGQLALGLARMVDLSTSGATTGAAANANRCEALMEKLRRTGAKKSDLDLIRERRAHRAAS
jgi:hypothetical protein